MKAILALADGKIYEGEHFGAENEVEANKIVPRAIGSKKNENFTSFKTCIFATIIAITEYI